MGQTHLSYGPSPLGELLALERRRRSLTRKRLAELVRAAARKDGEIIGTNEKAVARWELRGDVPQPATLRALAAVLGKPVEELVALARLGGTAHGRDDGLDFTIETYGLASGALDWRSLVPDLQRSVDRLCRLYAIRPPAELVPRVQQRVRLVQELLRDGARQGRRDLIETAGWLYLLLGTLHVDLDHPEAAWVSRDVAFRLGLELEHGELIGWCYETASWMSLVDGLWNDVLQAAEEGALHSPPRSSARVQNVLKVAHAQAALGDLLAAERALDAADDVVVGMDPTERPEHHFVFDAAKFEMFAAQVYTEAGAHSKAADYARLCIARSDDASNPARYHPRRASAARVDLATALLEMGELDEACDVASGVVSASFLGKHTLLRVGGLAARMRERYPKEPAVAELAELHRQAQTALRAS